MMRADSMAMATAMTIRRAERRDLADLGRLGAMLMETHHAFDRRRFIAPGGDASSGYAAFLGTILDEPDAMLFVAERDGARVTGYVWAALEPMSWKELRGPAGFIHAIAVAEEARGGGVARMLLSAATGWLRERGAPRVVLWTAARNEAARSLFLAAGFRTTMMEMTLELDG
jgi:ribosomal protein S18 acetylase RimI-like enzyme